MKKRFLITLLTLISLFGISEAFSQVVVKVRPNRPAIVIKKPVKMPNGKAWIDGHWRWSKRMQSYVWVKGHAVRAKRGHIWVAGKRSKRSHGWNYNPGHSGKRSSANDVI